MSDNPNPNPNPKIPRATTRPKEIPLVNLYDESEDRQEANKFYNGRLWRNVSKHFKALNPTCARCGMLAYAVDHIVPRRQLKGLDQYDLSNLASLCKACHNAKRKEERERY